MAQGDATARSTRGVGLMASELPGWTAVIAESVPGASVRGVRRLGGGVEAETFAIETTDGAVVVKRYRDRRRRRIDAVRFEWERLRFAQRVDAAVPRPLALDTDSRWFDMPALAMTQLPGRPNVHPRDVDGWLQQLASALVAIHDTDTTDADGPLLHPSPVQTWRPPKLRRPSPVAESTVAAIKRHLPGVSWQPVLIHGDFHPGNTLWRHGQLTGIADWTASRLGPASHDPPQRSTDPHRLPAAGTHRQPAAVRRPGDRLPAPHARRVGNVLTGRSSVTAPRFWSHSSARALSGSNLHEDAPLLAGDTLLRHRRSWQRIR
jgi:Phosphotransferase enzyme family